tara:strand:+ start:5743 stop:6222 length:480 start_codon:yes stop_codon:yes gene_type:complete
MSKQLLKLLLLIITATPLSAMAESVLSKDQIMEYIHTMPYDFEQMSKDSKAYDELLFRERNRIFEFVEIDKYPTPQERRRYYVLHAIDVAMTIWALNNRDNLREGNILLNNNPSNRALITNKLLTIPIYQNMNEPQVVVSNYIVGAVIVHNFYIINRYD